MTKEEAIEILKTADFPEDYTVEEVRQALDMAIKTLSAEKTTINPEKTTITDGDLISRQAVIDIIAILSNEQGNKLIEAIKDIPSAENTAKWINETEETIECGNCHHIFDDFGLLNGDQEKFYEYPNFCPNCGRKMIGVEMKGVEK